MTEPVRYDPSLEAPEKNELETQSELIETLLSISTTTLKDEREALRAVHAKSHGLIKASFTVLDGLPAELAQGIFAKPATYDALLRLSSAPGDLLPDKVSTHHGFAIKILNVVGPQLPGSEGDTQDFLLANGKAFSSPTASGFLRTLKMLAATTDKAEGLKVALSQALRALETTLEAAGAQSATLTALGGHPAYPVLSEEFFSQTPFRYGFHIAKFGAIPATAAQKALQGTVIALEEFDAQRQAVRTYFASKTAAWDFKVQLCTDLETMPIEKPDVAWPEKESPYVTVARIEAAPQESYSDEMAASLNKAGAFSPWHGVIDHQPLGAINRVRKAIYEASAGFRLSKNGCPYPHAAE